MYVIFPADEVVYLTYGINAPAVRPRPTLDNLLEPQVSLKVQTPETRTPTTPPEGGAAAEVPPSPSTTTESPRSNDIFNYGGPDVNTSRPTSPPPARPPSSTAGSRAAPEKPKKHRFPIRLRKAEDPNFGRTQRSPCIYNYEQPVPLSTPAFSKQNIFDQNFDAFFEVSNTPQFTEHVRIVTPEPGRASPAHLEAAFEIHEEECAAEDGEGNWRINEEDASPSPTMDYLRPPSLSAPTSPRTERRQSQQRHSRNKITIDKSSSLEEPSSQKKGGFLSRIRRRSADGRPNSRMATGQPEAVLRDITHPSLNEHLKNHNAVSFKLVKTVSDFTSQLAQMYEQQAGELQMLVATYRKKNGDLRKERPTCPSSLFHTWETLLQEVEADSQAHSDIASSLSRQVARPLVERTFHRKLQSRKVFAHRDSYETIISKTEEKLNKCRQEYKAAHQAYMQLPSQASMAAYMDAHNSYVQQLHATNGMLEEYNQETLPQLLQELEEIYTDLCSVLSDAVLQGAEIVSSRATDQARRYEGLISQCRAVSGTADLAHLARALPSPGAVRPSRRNFAPPSNATVHLNDGENDAPEPPPPENLPPSLKDELVLERLGPMQIRSNYDSLKKEALDLELQIRQLQDSLDALVRMQQRSLENHLFNKANELQEDISMKKFDLRVAQIHLSAVRAQGELLSPGRNERAKNLRRHSSLPEKKDVKQKQLQQPLTSQRSSEANPFKNTCKNHNGNKELFAAKADTGNVDRKLSSSSAGSMKNKWLKAFKSLKPPVSQQVQAPTNAEKKNGAGKDIRNSGDMETHNFLEYTYKKITPCDICSQVLRGHTRQGLRCRLCKMNVHSDCMSSAGRCQTKSRLLRRQKSTSEIEARIQDQQLDEEKSPEVDTTYQVLKHANEISRPGAESRSGITGPPTRAPASLSVQQPQIASNSGAARSIHDSGVRRRLFAGMKSFSVFGSRSRNNSPQHRSISLPESNTMRSSISALMLRQSESASPIAAPHSPRRQKLNLRMKSLSLDSPESAEQRRRPGVRLEGPGSGSGPGTTLGGPSLLNSTRLHCANAEFALHGSRVCRQALCNKINSKSQSTPSSPVHNRRLLSARNMRMSSVELPDDHDKSLSSASTSPCPSPVKQKPHRLLPTNLYVILYNFTSRHQDELDLKAGYKVTVIDTSNSDWWKGKCLGRVGYFPSKYCTRLQAGEKPLQVTHNLQVSDGDNGLMLLRDQIVIQVGEEVDGMVMIRSGDNRQGVCPLKFLQEV